MSSQIFFLKCSRYAKFVTFSAGYSRAKVQGQRSVSSEDGVETN